MSETSIKVAKSTVSYIRRSKQQPTGPHTSTRNHATHPHKPHLVHHKSAHCARCGVAHERRCQVVATHALSRKQLGVAATLLCTPHVTQKEWVMLEAGGAGGRQAVVHALSRHPRQSLEVKVWRGARSISNVFLDNNRQRATNNKTKNKKRRTEDLHTRNSRLSPVTKV
eukprot:33570-Chlamydomonas_euryale.AAC.3